MHRLKAGGFGQARGHRAINAGEGDGIDSRQSRFRFGASQPRAGAEPRARLTTAWRGVRSRDQAEDGGGIDGHSGCAAESRGLRSRFDASQPRARAGAASAV